MKKLSLKFILTILTFFIGIGAVSLWCLSDLYLAEKKSLFNTISSTNSVEFVSDDPCDYPQSNYQELEAEEAVIKAECFVIQNGYTDLPPIADRSKITPENVFPLDDAEGMAMRHNTLERKAYSYERSEMYDGSWVIMFRFKQRPKFTEQSDKEFFEKMGRAVVMDYKGNDIRIQHSQYPLTMPEAKIISR